MASSTNIFLSACRISTLLTRNPIVCSTIIHEVESTLPTFLDLIGVKEHLATFVLNSHNRVILPCHSHTLDDQYISFSPLPDLASYRSPHMGIHTHGEKKYLLIYHCLLSIHYSTHTRPYPQTHFFGPLRQNYIR